MNWAELYRFFEVTDPTHWLVDKSLKPVPAPPPLAAPTLTVSLKFA